MDSVFFTNYNIKIFTSRLKLYEASITIKKKDKQASRAMSFQMSLRHALIS